MEEVGVDMVKNDLAPDILEQVIRINKQLENITVLLSAIRGNTRSD